MGEVVYWNDTDIITVINKEVPVVKLEYLMEQVEIIKQISKDRLLPVLATGKGLGRLNVGAFNYSMSENYWGSFFCAAGVKPSESHFWKKTAEKLTFLMETWADHRNKPTLAIFTNLHEAFLWTIQKKQFPYIKYIQGKLNEEDNEILKLIFQNLTTSEISQILNITEAKIGNRLRRFKYVFKTTNMFHIFEIYKRTIPAAKGFNLDNFPDFGTYDNLLKHYKDIIEPEKDKPIIEENVSEFLNRKKPTSK